MGVLQDVDEHNHFFFLLWWFIQGHAWFYCNIRLHRGFGFFGNSCKRVGCTGIFPHAGCERLLLMLDFLFFTQIGSQAVCQGSHMESRGFKQKRHQSVTKLRSPEIYTQNTIK